MYFDQFPVIFYDAVGNTDPKVVTHLLKRVAVHSKARAVTALYDTYDVRNGETPESSGLKGDHLVGKYYVEFDKHYRAEMEELVAGGMDKDEAKNEAPLMQETRTMLQKWEDGDEEVLALWKKMNGWVYDGFDVTYKRLGVSFDKIYYESDTYLLGKAMVQEGLATDAFYQKADGSVWVDLTADGLDEKIVQRADGTSVYITQDIGTAQLKYDDFGMDKFVPLVGDEVTIEAYAEFLKN